MRSLRPALLGLALLACLVAPGATRAEEPPALTLGVASPTQCYADPATFQITVTFYNSGATELLVLPALVRRAYYAMDEGSATYVPHPGPPLSPWKGAFTVPAHDSRSAHFSGMRDGDGVWRVEAGHYRVVARYSVEPALEAQRPTASTLEPALRSIPLWLGELRSEPVAVLYEPQPDAARQIDFTQPDPCVRGALLRALAGIEEVGGARRYLEGQGFSCAFTESGFLTQRRTVTGDHLHCTWRRGGRVALTWHVGVIVHGKQVVGVVAVPERIYM
jgi:hypothetical protein